MAFKRVPLCMVVTLGQEYNIGEKPIVILYTYNINRHAGTPKKTQRKQNSTSSSNMVVIIYCYIGCEAEVTTWKRNREDHDVDIFIIQKVQDTVIHLEVDEEQWEVTQGSKRQAERTGFLAQHLSGLRHTDRCSSYIDLV